MTATFRAQLDAAILTGEGSGAIGKRLGINPTAVRRRRTTLRKEGQSIPSVIRKSETRP